MFYFFRLLLIRQHLNLYNAKSTRDFKKNKRASKDFVKNKEKYKITIYVWEEGCYYKFVRYIERFFCFIEK